jgi:hypothetical protein
MQFLVELYSESKHTAARDRKRERESTDSSMALSHLGSGLARPFTSFRIFVSSPPAALRHLPPLRPLRRDLKVVETSPPPPLRSGMDGKSRFAVSLCRRTEPPYELVCARGVMGLVGPSTQPHGLLDTVAVGSYSS